MIITTFMPFRFSAQTPIFSVSPSSFSLSPMFYLMNSIIINQTSLSTAKARAAFYYKQMAAKPTVCVTQLIWILRRGSGCRHCEVSSWRRSEFFRRMRAHPDQTHGLACAQAATLCTEVVGHCQPPSTAFRLPWTQCTIPAALLSRPRPRA